jgi:hypothetical protein
MTVPNSARVEITSTVRVSTMAQIRLAARAKAAHQLSKKVVRVGKKPAR